MTDGKDMMLTDATCYESLMRFPTDVKLLWEMSCGSDMSSSLRIAGDSLKWHGCVWKRPTGSDFCRVETWKTPNGVIRKISLPG